MTTVRPLRSDETEAFLDGVWLPFARETDRIDGYHSLAAGGVRENAIEYRRTTIENGDRRTFVAVLYGGLVGCVPVETRDSPPVLPAGRAASFMACTADTDTGARASDPGRS